jgi:putative membrane protein
MILSAILHWVLTALILLLVAKITPGVYLAGFGTAMMAALILGLVNFFLRPLLSLLTLPINVLTLGLFSFVINALMFGLVAWIVPGFEVTSFLSALVGSLLLAVMTAILDMLFTHRQRLA